MKRFLEVIPAPELRSALEWSTDPGFNNPLAAMMDPRFKRYSLTALCRKFQISLNNARRDGWRQSWNLDRSRN